MGLKLLRPRATRPSNSGIAVGKNHGYQVVKVVKVPRQSSLSRKRPSVGGRLAREIVREVAGYSPYEKRIIEMLRVGSDKKALRLAKRKIGTHYAAKRKREEMARVLATQNLVKAQIAASE